MATKTANRKTVKVGFNPVFKPFNECTKRYRLAKGSAGSGKSVNIAQDFILKLGDPKYKGANLLCVRKVDSSNKDSTYAELKAAIYRIYGDQTDRFWKIRANPMEIISKKTENSVIFRGMKDNRDREKVKSITFPKGKLTWIWVEEATELFEADVDILDDRLRGDLSFNPNLYYQMTFSFNPVSARHWIKEKYFDTVNPDIFTHQSTYLQNRFIDEAYHRRMLMRKERDPEGYQVYGLGDWGETAGLIFHNYEVKDLDKNLEHYDDICIGQDFGYNHANAILLLGWKDAEIYILSEIYGYEKDTNEWIQIAEKKKLSKKKKMYCDSAEPDRIKMWRKAGYMAVPVSKEQNSVIAQIDWLKQRNIYIDPSCQNAIKEISQYKWKKDEKSNSYLDEPVSVFDDAMAALRYGIEEWRKNKIARMNRLESLNYEEDF
jgi:phage terminase large subunit